MGRRIVKNIPDEEILKHFDEFVEQFLAQLLSDNERWGNTFLQRNRKDQRARIWRWMSNTFALAHPIPWLKVIGEAYIGWLRDTHPEMSDNWAEPEDLGE